ncbi:MAG TPA: hypothetical protein VEA37_01410, partial [Flavobacterium sp.]|nr:hypothetical protein [Flavobacterium sp.]
MSLLLQTIPAALLAALSPVSAVVLLFVILPTYLLKDTFAGQPVNFLEMATVMVALGLAIRFAWLPEFRAQVIERLRWLRQQKGIVMAVLVFLLAAIVAVIFSADLYRSLGVLKGWYILPMLGGLMAYLVFRKPWDVYNAITGLSVAAGLVSWYGLIDYFRIHDPWKYVGMRLDSFYTSPNYLALYTGPIIVLTLNLLLFVPAIRKHRITLWLLSGSLV